MISFRYHIVSLVGVFLALALGILLGSSVVRGPVEAKLNADLKDVRADRDHWKGEASQREADASDVEHRLTEEIAPWAEHGRLVGTPIVTIIAGQPTPAWREHVLDALVAAGAQTPGSLVLSNRFMLAASGDVDDLESTVRGIVPSFAAKRDAAVEALTLLGDRFFEPTGRALIDALAQAGFLTVQGVPDTDWPPSDASVVMLASTFAHPTRFAEAAAALARSIAASSPTLVVGTDPGPDSAVSRLRKSKSIPKLLSTFDSGTNESDPGGLGVVAAMLASTEGRGGHFGAEKGRTFIAPPGPAK